MRDTNQLRKKGRRKKNKPKILWGRIILLAIAVLVLAGTIIWGISQGISYVNQTFINPTSQSMESDSKAETSSDKKNLPTIPLEQKSLDKPMYILLVGKDKTGNPQGDAIYLMSVNKEQKNVEIIGIPANTKIESRDKKSVQTLNTMYSTGGMELTKAVVEDLFHIVIPYYVVVEESDFVKSVDILGTPQLYVEKNMAHTDIDTGKDDIHLLQGYQNLTGDKALQYMRYLDDDKDGFSRVQRQERLLKTLYNNYDGSFGITKAWHVWRIWNHLDSNISTSDAVKLAFSLRNVEKENINFYILPGVKEKLENTVYWNIDPTETQRLVGITMGNI